MHTLCKNIFPTINYYRTKYTPLPLARTKLAKERAPIGAERGPTHGERARKGKERTWMASHRDKRRQNYPERWPTQVHLENKTISGQPRLMGYHREIMSSGSKTLVARHGTGVRTRPKNHGRGGHWSWSSSESRYSLDPVADDTKASKSQREQTPTTK
ncbi:hypothetical protein J6590_026550 [Homalodisca vitripennis]|nr:hypothetical protein J6590_026550 [Homalodisca vitripennis]